MDKNLCQNDKVKDVGKSTFRYFQAMGV